MICVYILPQAGLSSVSMLYHRHVCAVSMFYHRQVCDLCLCFTTAGL